VALNCRIIIEKDRPHNAQRECGKQQNEQCPKQIIRTLHEMLLELNGTISDQLYQLLAIGVSGQMHGVVLWNSQSL
jgi:sugar (pentulose or hexulose) kinase